VGWWSHEPGVKALKFGVVGVAVAVAALAFTWQTRPRPVRVVEGSITTIAKVSANITWGIAISKDGSVYYGDGNELRRILPDGTNRLLARTVPGPDGFIRDVAVAPDGTLYLTDDTGVVRHFAHGTLTTIARSQASASPLNNPSPSLLWEPRGVAVAPDGTLYIADMSNNRVVARTPDGHFVRVGGYIDMPDDMAIDSHGRPYVVDYDGRVFEITANNSFNEVFDIASTRARVDQQSTSPLGISVTIAFSPTDDLIVADEDKDVIYRIENGTAQRLVGGRGAKSSPDGTAASDASIGWVGGIAVSRDNALVMCEPGRLREIHLV
jgi:sugar lactone lactonase YvrE